MSRPLQSAINLLSVSFSVLTKAPEIVKMNVSSSVNSIQLSARLSSKGSLYCAVFLRSNPSPTSLNDVTQQKYFSTADSSNVSSISIQGLQAMTSYSLYCYTAMMDTTSTFSDMVKQVRYVNTSCCKSITVNQAAVSITADKIALNFITAFVSVPPSNSLQLAFVSNATNTVGNIFFPTLFSIRSDSRSTFYSISVRSLPVGFYVYSLQVIGPSANEYDVVYRSSATVNGGSFFQAISSSQQPPPPIITGVIFSDDGSYLSINFDSPTNKGGVQNMFQCSDLFNFKCSNISQCQWIDSSTVYAFIYGGAYCATPGNTFRLGDSAAIKAACLTVTKVCPSYNTWANTTRISVKIQASLNPIVPSVVVYSPTVIGACDNLTLDLTSSSGSGGRAWNSYSMKVLSSAGNNVTKLQKYLDRISTVSPPTPIPHFLITKGYSYTFLIRLCNFLTKCSEVSKSVLAIDSTIPTVSLPGDSVRATSRNSILSIGSIASVASCGVATSSASYLDYQWVVFQNGIQLLSLTSISKDRAKFILPPYSLTTNSYYVVTVTATIRSTMKSSSASVTVFVQIGNIHITIKDGMTRNMKASSTIQVDASNSYDEDQIGVSGVDAGLFFEWSCSQIAPVFDETCGASLSLYSANGIMSVSSLDSSAGSYCKISLLLTDRSRSRSDQATVWVTVVASTATLVSATSNLLTGKMNPGQLLQLTGIISVADISNATASWTLSDDSFSLSQIAMSPTRLRITSSTTSTYLVVPPNSFPGGTVLTFSLSCQTAIEKSPAIASVTITINSPPRPGIFQVNPITGTELSTSFVFTNRQWTDSDLPISYQLGYFSVAGLTVVLQSRSVTSYGSSLLPAGLDTEKNTLLAFSQIFDSLNANSSAIASVTVTKGAALSLDQMSLFVSKSANSSSLTVDEVKKLNALSSYLINSVNCSAAPNCSSLNRLNCLKTINTCGECKSIAYIGNSGDSNSPCFPAAFKTYGSICITSSQCSSPQLCESGICVFPMKTCVANCSDHGKCQFINTDSGLPVNECRLRDDHCDVKCECDSDYTGSKWCQLRSSDLIQKQEMRSQVISNVGHLISQEYPDKETVSGWISNLADATQFSDELTVATSAVLLNMTKVVVNLANQVQLSNTAIFGILSTVDSATTHMASQTANSTSKHAQTAVSDTMDTLQVISSALATNMLPGQDGLSTVQGQFRLSVAVISGENEEGHTISLPQTASEMQSANPSSSVNVPAVTNSNASSVAISLMSIRSSLFEGGSQFKSNPMKMHFSSLPCQFLDQPCEVVVVMQTNGILSFAATSTNDVETFQVKCPQIGFNSSYKCKNGHIIDTSCKNVIGIVRWQCPPLHFISACTSLGSDSTVESTSSCRLLNYTSTNTTCACGINLNTGAATIQRRLQESGTSTSHSVSVTTLLKSVAASSKSTVLSAAQLNSDDIKREWTVLVTVGMLAVFVLVFMALGHYYDLKNETESNMKQLQVIEKRVNTVEHKKRLNKIVRNVESDELALIEESLPQVLGSKSFAEKFTAEVKQHHRWLAVIYHYSESFPRSLRVLSLAVNIIVMLFVQSVTYNLTNPNDGSCAEYQNKSSCLTPKSSLGTGDNMCSWTNSGESGSCNYSDPTNNFTVVLFVAIFSAIVSTPIAIIQTLIIRRYLAAPLHSNKIVQSADADSIIQQSKNKPSSFFFKKSKIIDMSCTLELDRLSTEILKYRDTLTHSQRREFDLIWGLDSSGKFITKRKETHSLLKRLIPFLPSSKSPENVERMVTLELHTVSQKEAHELRFFMSPDIKEKDKTKRLLYLFQCDLLPGISGQILATKSARDIIPKFKPVTTQHKLAGYSFVLIMNASMLFYIFLFAMQQSKTRQNAWLQSFVIWFTTELLFVSTLVVLVVHHILPSFVLKDIRKLRNKLTDLIQDFQENVASNGNSDQPLTAFNAAEYFFVSTKLAQRLPENGVARMIARFRTPWPRQSFEFIATKDDSRSYRTGLTNAVGSFSGILFLFVLGAFLNFPVAMQDGAVHVTAAVVVGYAVLLHRQLFAVFPALAFLPMFCLCVAIHFVFRTVKVSRSSAASIIQPAHRYQDHALDNALLNPEETENNKLIVDNGRQSKQHIARRASLVQGAKLVQILQNHIIVDSSVSSCFDSKSSDMGSVSDLNEDDYNVIDSFSTNDSESMEKHSHSFQD
eukprot:CAMPEP_0170122720 /NCGR_PEP_ID=MMETSP0020_2-20130122/16918_1 /TAXON_ID=98059 /ORGANISM="Dinobryon sp., Strain UTEXLB2267" /LENGTH=2177 /DNA_ID=CAMNT_0010353853 /DNA_START=1571 /DNA_END=8104 /DNA_ORIENTATION=+